MRRILSHVSQAMVMAAIANTLMYLPVGALLAAIGFAAMDVSFREFVTFGGALNGFQGVLAWWSLGFLPALAYAAFVLPWSPQA